MGQEEAQAKYLFQAQRMQTGVAQRQQIQPETEKSLRVGITSCMVTDAALAQLLIDRGIFTLEEYGQAVADQMEVEADNIEAELSKHYKTGITLAGSIEEMRQGQSDGNVFAISSYDITSGTHSYTVFDGTHVVNGDFGESEELILTRWVSVYGAIKQISKIQGEYTPEQCATKIAEVMGEINK